MGEKAKADKEKEKSVDYLYSQRRPDEQSNEARTRAVGARVKFESYYKLAPVKAFDPQIWSVYLLLLRLSSP